MSCWVSCMDGAASLWLFRWHRKVKVVSTKLRTKGLAFLFETSLISCRGEGAGECCSLASLLVNTT